MWQQSTTSIISASKAPTTHSLKICYAITSRSIRSALHRTLHFPMSTTVEFSTLHWYVCHFQASPIILPTFTINFYTALFGWQPRIIHVCRIFSSDQLTRLITYGHEKTTLELRVCMNAVYTYIRNLVKSLCPAKVRFGPVFRLCYAIHCVAPNTHMHTHNYEHLREIGLAGFKIDEPRLSSQLSKIMQHQAISIIYHYKIMQLASIIK